MHIGFGMIYFHSPRPFLRALIKTMIFIQCFSFFSCNMFGGKEKVGEINQVINGVCKIQIKLRSNAAGWALNIGDPYGNTSIENSFNKNLVEENKIIMDKQVTLNILNDGKSDLHIGHDIIPSKSKMFYFHGTLENLISNTTIPLTNINKEKYKFMLEFIFDEKDIKIKSPIPITASWNDAL